MVATETNADEANTSGAITGNEAACAVSGSPTASPTVANTHDNAYPNNRTRPIPARNPNTFVWIRNPTMNPAMLTRITTKKLRVRSAVVRPASTAERDIGSEWNRSSIPLLRSAASPTAVSMAPKTTIWQKIPGIR